MRKIKFISILTLLNIAFSAFSQNNIVDEIAWIVGDEIILKSDVEEQKIRMQMEGEKIKGDPPKKVGSGQNRVFAKSLTRASTSRPSREICPQ